MNVKQYKQVFFLNNAISQKPAVSQLPSTWALQICFILSNFQNLWLTKYTDLILFICSPSLSALSYCAELLLPRAAAEPVFRKGSADYVAAKIRRDTRHSIARGPEYFLQQELGCMRLDSKPSKQVSATDSQPNFQPYFPQSARLAVLMEKHLLQVISAPGNVIPAKLKSGTSKLCCPVSTLKYQR